MCSLGTHGKCPVSQHQGQRRARVTASEMRPVSSGTRCLVDAASGRCHQGRPCVPKEKTSWRPQYSTC